ncbi:MAG: TPM domain-containing protein, partial [Saprospiraceae bacterium]
MKLFMDNTRCAGRGVRRVRFLALLAGLLFLVAGALQAQTEAELFPPKPEPAVYVHDLAGWLTTDQRQALDMKLRAYWDSTSTQIVVMIRKDIGDYDKASYAFELGNRWGIGTKEEDNGLVLLIKTEAPERGVFIATGYGLEGALPDITAGRIIRNTMAPYFRQGAYSEGINAGVDEIMLNLSGEYTRDKSAGSGKAAVAIGQSLYFLLLFIFLFGVL